METSIIKIGNSRGLIIPKGMLNQIGANRKIEIKIMDGGLFIRPILDNPRKGWAEAFANAFKTNQNTDGDPFEGIENEFDREEWTW